MILGVIAAIPPAMMLWFWNEDRPLIMEPIRMKATEGRLSSQDKP